MIAQKSKFAQWTRLLLVLPVGLSGYAQGTLINSTTRNGSFEDGVAGPWSGYLTVMEDASFATDGDWYATIDSTVRPALTVQNLTPNPNAGLTFSLSFDARMGNPGYNLVSTMMSARTPAGASLSASVIPISAPTLTTAVWQTYQYELQMPASWDSAGITFSIAFNNDQPLNGIPHYGYLDNIVLQQIPEPSELALFGLGGGAVWLATCGWRRKGWAVKHPVPKIG
jgi:hypothetical protein